MLLWYLSCVNADRPEERNEYYNIQDLFGASFFTDASICLCDFSPVPSSCPPLGGNQMHLLGLVPGSVLMCKCVGQFSCRGPACRKCWNTPRSPSCSQSRSPARYLHRAFRDGAMREERVSLVMRECKRFPAVIFRFKASTHTTTLLRPVPPRLCPWLPPPPLSLPAGR